MNLRLLFLCLTALLFGVLPARATVDRKVEKDFKIGGDTTLKLDICQGPVRIEVSPDECIHFLVRETMDAADDQAADRAQQELSLEFGQAEREVSATARFRRTSRWTWQSWPPVALACTIKVPRRCGLDLVVHDGDLTVGSFDGALKARAENGAIFTGEIGGPVHLESRRGDVSVTACRGDLVITAKAGNVTVGGAGGPVTIAASGGLIEVQSVRGRARIEADGADIKVAFAHPCLESAKLHAAGGDIEAIFDVRDRFTLKAGSSYFGQVRVRNLLLEVAAGKAGSSSLVGTLNGGGPLVEIESSGGNVRLIGREP